MLVNGSTGARSSAMTGAERRRMNTYAETARTAMARAFQLCARSARIATIPPAPTPATKPVTASPAKAETGAPTRIVRTRDLAVAPAARGCSERKASARKTNGRRTRPKAMYGAANGALSLSEPCDEPGHQRPVAGHEQER